MAKKNQHVVPLGGSAWGVRGEGNRRLTKITNTKQGALDRARHIAQKQGTEVVIHGKDGKIQDKDSYGKDPCPPEDTKH